MMVRTMPQNDIVVDANVMSLYGTAAAGQHKGLFVWLGCCGGLCISKAVLREYSRQGSPLVAALVDRLLRDKRCSFIKNSTLKAFEADAGYAYTCNAEDVAIARTVFRSFRKLLISMDVRLRSDVNGFPIVNAVKPEAYPVALGVHLICIPAGACRKGLH